jgi:hypothetical protein
MHSVETPALERLPDGFETAPGADELRTKVPDLERSIISLESICVSEETVAVSGSVSPGFVLTGDLVINGHLVPFDTVGRFWAVVKLQGHTGLNLSLETGIHGTVTLDVPLKAS